MKRVRVYKIDSNGRYIILIKDISGALIIIDQSSRKVFLSSEQARLLRDYIKSLNLNSKRKNPKVKKIKYTQIADYIS